MICPRCLEKNRDCTCLLGKMPIRFPDDTVITKPADNVRPVDPIAAWILTEEQMFPSAEAAEILTGHGETNVHVRLSEILREVRSEVLQAAKKHEPMASPHEGYAVIKEELEELWDEIKRDRGCAPMAREEALQVAAMALRYVLDLTDSPEA